MSLRERLQSHSRRRAVSGGGRRQTRGLLRGVGIAVVVALIALWAVSWYWSWEPDPFDVLAYARETTPGDTEPTKIPGSVITTTLMGVTKTLLEKPGGYLGNDVMPPSVLLDNMPRWEFGVIVQIRDLAQSLRNDMSRSRSQSSEDKDLAIAEPQFNFPSNSWMFPASESEYRKGIAALRRYLGRLASPSESNTQFYARADNLNEWLSLVNKRLGSLAQRLSASVGEYRFNVDLAGDPSARQATPKASGQIRAETPWLQIDNVFYEARGSTWALVHFLRAARIDFKEVLADKNAEASLDQIIQALEQTQRPLWSPMVLNGNGYGLLANHSLTIASYIARANAGIIDLQRLLTQG